MTIDLRRVTDQQLEMAAQCLTTYAGWRKRLATQQELIAGTTDRRLRLQALAAALRLTHEAVERAQAAGINVIQEIGMDEADTVLAGSVPRQWRNWIETQLQALARRQRVLDDEREVLTPTDPALPGLDHLPSPAEAHGARLAQIGRELEHLASTRSALQMLQQSLSSATDTVIGRAWDSYRPPIAEPRPVAPAAPAAALVEEEIIEEPPFVVAHHPAKPLRFVQPLPGDTGLCMVAQYDFERGRPYTGKTPAPLDAVLVKLETLRGETTRLILPTPLASCPDGVVAQAGETFVLENGEWRLTVSIARCAVDPSGPNFKTFVVTGQLSLVPQPVQAAEPDESDEGGEGEAEPRAVANWFGTGEE